MTNMGLIKMSKSHGTTVSYLRDSYSVVYSGVATAL